MLNNINDTLFNYSWQPNTSINCDTCATPIAFPISTTLYTVDVSHIPGCSFSDSVLINVIDLKVGKFKLRYTWITNMLLQTFQSVQAYFYAATDSISTQL